MRHALRLHTRQTGLIFTLAFLAICSSDNLVFAQKPEMTLANKIISETGVTGGLIVHLGCGDGRVLEALQRGRSITAVGVDVSRIVILLAKVRKLFKKSKVKPALNGKSSATAPTANTS